MKMSPVRQPLFDAVVFDLDGVLIDSFDVMRHAFAHAYREAVGDGEPPFAEYRTHQGRYFPDIMRMMGLPLEMQETFVQRSTELIDEVRIYPEVRELLQVLHDAGIPTAVATGKSGLRARAVLRAHGLMPFLHAVVGSDEVSQPKPAPDIVVEAIRRIGATPQSTVMIGDAVIDIQSGRAAGVATAAATWGETSAELLRAEHPDHVLSRPLQLVALTEAAETGAIGLEASVGRSMRGVVAK